MAAVTVKKMVNNVAGSRRQRAYTVSGANNDTLDTGFKQIDSVSVNNPAVVTKVAPTGGTLTFSASGAFTDVEVLVQGI